MENKLSIKTVLAILATGLLSFCGVVVETASNISFPTLMNEFSINTATVQWATTIYLLSVSIMMPVSVYLKNQFSYKKLFVVSNILFLIGLCLGGYSNTFQILLVGRLIQGFGTGIALPLMFNIIIEDVPAKDLGKMMGIGSLITAAAPAVGPTFGGLVVSTIGWRFIFIFLIPIIMISLCLGVLSIPQNRINKGYKLDIVSVLLIIITFSLIIYSLSNFSKLLNGNASLIAISLTGILSLVILIAHLKVSESPIININILRNKSYSTYLLVFFSIQFITLSFSFILPNFLQVINGQSAFNAGLLIFPGAILGALLSPIGGKLLDSFGAKKPILYGISLIIVSIALFLIFNHSLSSMMISFFYSIYMLGLSLSFGNIMTSGLSALSPQFQADGNALLNTVQQLAGAFGTAIIASIIAFGENKATKNTIGMLIGTKYCFYVMLFMIIVGFIGLLMNFKRN